MDTTHQIRPLHTGDLAAAMKLVWEVFLEFEAPGYSERGIAEFRDYIALPNITARLQSGEMQMWGCFVQDSIVGVIATAPANHVSLLFVNKSWHYQGIARALYEAALEKCRQDGSYDAMSVNSSPYAAQAYHRLGFTDTDTEQVVNGLRFIPMKHAFR